MSSILQSTKVNRAINLINGQNTTVTASSYAIVSVFNGSGSPITYTVTNTGGSATISLAAGAVSGDIYLGPAQQIALQAGTGSAICGVELINTT